MESNPKKRMGSFFILLGLIMLILFIGSVAGKGENDFIYLLLSAISILLGYFLIRRKASEEAGPRFSGVRKARDQAQKKRSEREEKKHKKKQEKRR